jgi:thiol-disulfide isomerase/thioredoxin
MSACRPQFPLALIVLLAFAALPGLAGSEDESEPAPRFHAKTLDGEQFNNASIKGKVVLLDFWTTWCPCPYCSQEEAIVDSLGQEFADKGLLVLAVDVAESKKKVKMHLQEHPRSCKVVLTEDTNLAAMYQANTYPIYVVIDRDGNIAGTQRGAAGERALRIFCGTPNWEQRINPVPFSLFITYQNRVATIPGSVHPIPD